jgi:sensor domain CHASE-containing protein
MIETVAKLSMVGLFAAAAPIDASEPTLWANWGLAGVVVAYVLWRDWQRERRLSAAIEAQQRWVRETLVETLARNATAMERMATWLERADDPRWMSTRRLRAVEESRDHHG